MRKNPWRSPKYRAMMLKKRKEAAARPEVQEKKRQAMLRLYEVRPELATAKAKSTAQMWKSFSKTKLAKMSKDRSKAATAQNKRQWADPKYRAKMLKVRKARS